MKMTSFRINGRPVSRLLINGREVSLRQEPVFSDALCFTAEEPGSTVKLSKVGSAPTVNLQTSTDGISWTPYTIGDTMTLANAGDKVYFKAIGSNNAMATATNTNYNKFVMTGRIAASGNTNSLLEEDEDTARELSLINKIYCFSNLFNGCTVLTTSPELPATILSDSCYYLMFTGCSSLITPPVLPATTLTIACYCLMFQNCSKLASAPVLPATIMKRDCYSNMFSGCSSLTTPPVLPAMTLDASCYNSLFRYCTSLSSAPELPATQLAASCYTGIFTGCAKLTTAPELPATTLVSECYSYMFEKCTGLTKAPDLPAETLAYRCYYYMFSGCSNLNSIKVSFSQWSPSSATSYWLPNNAGTFECPWDLITNTSSRTTSTVPANWTMVAV